MAMVQQRFPFVHEVSHAVLSEDRVYRYMLTRSLDGEPWDGVADSLGRARKSILFIMLNPSTADEHANDPTIEKCMKFARAWGYQRLIVGNLFAYRLTDSKKLGALWRDGLDLVGTENDQYLLTLSKLSGRTICGWGNEGLIMGRGEAVRKILGGSVECFKRNLNGTPIHPLYQRDAALPIPYEP